VAPSSRSTRNQSYASDAGSIGWFEARARDVGIRPQLFVVCADLRCGSTIGPLTATRLGVQTVDVGSPVLSMHSVREQAHAADIGPTIATVRAHLTTSA
jgi:aspartyl aminopeptidase